METNWYDFSSKLCQGSFLLECGMMICSKFESSKSGAVALSARLGLNRQLRFIDKTRRPAGRAGGAVPNAGNLLFIARAANVALLDWRKRRRSIMARDYMGLFIFPA